MKNKTRNIHLVCNAHLDPVWQWRWEEGAAEAVSTFRTAADLCEQNEAFVFNHNEVILYKWVQEYEPSLFKRIQKLVKKKRWHIMGGWYLQPDCNMPSGESFVRQILTGRLYFKKHFNETPKTAINFDPFGHSRGLVQILAKSGYDSYLFGRPTQDDCQLPADEFVWEGFDGSQVLATRFKSWYNSHLGKALEKIISWRQNYPNEQYSIILWGVGNHGGGPSKKDLADINRYINKHRDVNIAHSTPELYFKELKRNKKRLPVFKKSLNPWAVGCYTSQILIKQKMRLLENELYSTEKMATNAYVQGLADYPQKAFHDALEDLLFGQFHDILPGSSIEPVEQDSLQCLDHGLEIIARVKAKMFFSLANIQKKAKKEQIPILVYNPHPYPVTQTIECEFQLADFNPIDNFTDVCVLEDSRELPTQVEKEDSNLMLDWRKRVAFNATLKPSSMNRFDCKLQKTKHPKLVVTTKINNHLFHFKNDDMSIAINPRTGLIDQWHINGHSIVNKEAFKPVVIKDDQDSWGMHVDRYEQFEGAFRLMNKNAGILFSGLESQPIKSLRVIEEGSVRIIVEAVLSYNNSFICQRYKLPRTGTEIEVEARIYWNEKNRLLKLSVPISKKIQNVLGKTAYGTEQLVMDGQENVSQQWVAVVFNGRRLMMSCINDGIYGSNITNNELRLTLLRSPAYACHPLDNGQMTTGSNRFSPRIDQGSRVFRFWFNAGSAASRLKKLDREALVKNEKPMALSFFPLGNKPAIQKSFIELSDDRIQITAIKKAEKSNDIIIRLFEPTGKKCTTKLKLGFINKKVTINMLPFELKTLRINKNSGKIRETNLLE